jgi:hypothetical protein
MAVIVGVRIMRRVQYLRREQYRRQHRSVNC